MLYDQAISVAALSTLLITNLESDKKTQERWSSLFAMAYGIGQILCPNIIQSLKLSDPSTCRAHGLGWGL